MDNLKGDSGGGAAVVGIEVILSNALRRLRRMDSYEAYLDYIRSEWYATVSDLLLALEDGKAWSDLQLPGRLKLEIKSELLGLQVARKDNNGKDDGKNDSSKISTENKSNKTEQWIKYFSNEHNSYFYCNSDTNVTQWDEPTGNVDVQTYISPTNSPSAKECSASELDVKEHSSHPEEDSEDGSDLSAKESKNSYVYNAFNAESKGTFSTQNSGASAGASGVKSIPLDSVSVRKSMTETNNSINGRTFFPDSSSTANGRTFFPESSSPSVGGRTVFSESSPNAYIVNDAYAVNGPVPICYPIPERRSSFSNGRSSFSLVSCGSEKSTGSDENSDIQNSDFQNSDFNSMSQSQDSCDFDGSPDERLITRLADMGFSYEAAAAALRRSGNNLPAAASLLLLNPPAYEDSGPHSGTNSEMGSSSDSWTRPGISGPGSQSPSTPITPITPVRAEKPKIAPPKNNYAPRARVQFGGFGGVSTVKPTAPLLPPPTATSSSSFM